MELPNCCASFLDPVTKSSFTPFIASDGELRSNPQLWKGPPTAQSNYAVNRDEYKKYKRHWLTHWKNLKQAKPRICHCYRRIVQKVSDWVRSRERLWFWKTRSLFIGFRPSIFHLRPSSISGSFRDQGYFPTDRQGACDRITLNMLWGDAIEYMQHLRQPASTNRCTSLEAAQVSAPSSKIGQTGQLAPSICLPRISTDQWLSSPLTTCLPSRLLNLYVGLRKSEPIKSGRKVILITFNTYISLSVANNNGIATASCFGYDQSIPGLESGLFFESGPYFRTHPDSSSSPEVWTGLVRTQPN